MKLRLIFATLLFFPIVVYGQDFVGESFSPATVYEVQKGDGLYKIAQDFDLGFDEIIYANPDLSASRILQIGQKIILPTTHLIPDAPRNGIVINLAEARLYFFNLNGEVKSFPISIGADEKTPIGKTRIALKRQNPTWTPPKSIREENPELPEVVPAGPNNPLGDYALNLDASKNAKWQSIMIHGTNVPHSIGSRVSHGCIRMYPWDIEALFNSVDVGVAVNFVNQPIKAAVINDEVYLEVHLREAPEVVFENLGVKKKICKIFAACESEIDWQRVDEVVRENSGVAVRVNY